MSTAPETTPGAAPGSSTGSPQGNATLRDVAERAGVSMSTVSRVLGGTYPTAPATRAKVMAAVRELDYAVNAQARALAGTRTKLVGILVGSVAAEFSSHIAQGVQEQAVDEGRICLVSSTGRDPERELTLVQLMREQRAEAIILVGSVVADEEYHARMSRYAHSLAAAGSRLVLIGRPPLAPEVPAVSVEYDNAGGSYAATSYLLSQEHDRILYLGQRTGHSTFEGRLDGYRRALTDHGVGYDESLVMPGPFGREAGYQMMSTRLAGGPIDFTAVLAGDDLSAAGAMHALRDRGLRVPDDLSMVGYDDLPVAADLDLTTVHIPHEELGRTAVRLALHHGDARGRGSAAIHRLLGTHLVVRNSVRPRAATAHRVPGSTTAR